MPNIPDKKDWRVFGQTLDITLPLEDPVSVIKAKIHEATNMPPGKQKLNMEVCLRRIRICGFYMREINLDLLYFVLLVLSTLKFLCN